MERVDDSFESETWSSTVHLDIASKRSLVGYLLRVTCTGRYALLDLTSVSADRGIQNSDQILLSISVTTPLDGVPATFSNLESGTCRGILLL